jgi:hypothetical protein
MEIVLLGVKNENGKIIISPKPSWNPGTYWDNQIKSENL